MDIARRIGINLTTSYLFHPTTSDNGVRDAPLSSAIAEARLKLYLKEMKADKGETLPGFRSGFRKHLGTDRCGSLGNNGA